MLTEKIVINIIGMSCQHCVKSVKDSINGLDGIIDVIVSLDSNSAEVEFDSSKVSVDAIKDAIVEAGYEAA